MSFILDALKKSDAHRRAQVERPNSLGPIPRSQWREDSKLPRRSWLLRATALIFMGLALVWFASNWKDLEFPSKGDAEPEDALVNHIEGSPPVIAVGEPVASERFKTIPTQDVPFAEVATEPSIAEGVVESGAGEERRLSVTDVLEAPGLNAPSVLREMESPALDTSNVATRAVELVDDASQVDETVEAWVPEQPPYLELWELPTVTQDKLSSFNLTVHVFDEVARARFVLINGRRYTEGAQLSPDVALYAITPQGAILDVDGYLVLMTR